MIAKATYITGNIAQSIRGFWKFNERHFRVPILILFVIWAMSVAMSYLHQISIDGVCSVKLGLLFGGGLMFWITAFPVIAHVTNLIKTQSWHLATRLSALVLGGIVLLAVNQVFITGLVNNILKNFFGCEDLYAGTFIDPIQNNIVANAMIFALISFSSWTSSQVVPKPVSITVRSGNKESRIIINNIRWIETDRNCLTLHGLREKHVIYTSLKKFKEDFLDENFIQVHRSLVVNRGTISAMRRLKTGDGTLILNDGTELRFSRNYKANIQL